MLLRAAAKIESLTQRAMSAERLYHEEQEKSTQNAEQRDAAKRASDTLLLELDALRVQLAEVTAQAAVDSKAFETERTAFAAEREREPRRAWQGCSA